MLKNPVDKIARHTDIENSMTWICQYIHAIDSYGMEEIKIIIDLKRNAIEG